MQTVIDVMLEFVDRGWNKYFCFVKRWMSSLLIPPRSSEDSKERAIDSAVSDIMVDYCGGTKINEKLDGVPKGTLVWITVARAAGM